MDTCKNGLCVLYFSLKYKLQAHIILYQAFPTLHNILQFRKYSRSGEETRKSFNSLRIT